MIYKNVFIGIISEVDSVILIKGKDANTGINPFCANQSFFKEQLYKNKSLDLGEKKLRQAKNKVKLCCPTEHKNKVSKLAILKTIGTKY